MGASGEMDQGFFSETVSDPPHEDQREGERHEDIGDAAQLLLLRQIRP